MQHNQENKTHIQIPLKGASRSSSVLNSFYYTNNIPTKHISNSSPTPPKKNTKNSTCTRTHKPNQNKANAQKRMGNKGEKVDFYIPYPSQGLHSVVIHCMNHPSNKTKSNSMKKKKQ